MSKMKKIAAMTAALLISANTMGYLPQDSIIISNVTANAAEEEITSVEINETNFPDENFREYVKSSFDKDGDGVLSAEEIADVTSLHLGELGISDLTGIQHFKNLSSLWCYDNNLTTLDVSNNTELKILSCNNNQLTSLDVSHNTLLTDLMCHNNQLASVDLSNTNCLEGWEFGVELNNNKHRIKITDNTFDLSTLPTDFDVSKASEWTNATVEGNILTIEDITKEVTYTYDCGLGFSETFAFVPYNDASEMDVEINEITFPDAIFRKYIEENFDKDGNKILSYDELVKATFMKINGLEVSDMTGLQHFFNLQTLYCSNNRITSLDVSNNTELEVLSCYNNQITSLDVSNNAKLRTLTCSENQLTSLDLSNNPALTSFSCDDNKYKIALTNNTFDLSTLPGGFDISKASDWKNATVKDNILTVIDDTALITYSYKCGEEVVCFNLFTSNFVGETFEAIEIDNNNFPDDVFRRYVAEEFDENNDLALSYDEVMNVTDISLDESNLYDLTGIQYFKNLSSLWCYDNNLTTLDVSENTALKILVCDHNELTSLDVSNNTALEWLYCDNNQLTSLDVSNNTALIDLSCYENQLTSLDLSNNTALKRLMTDDNKYEIALTDNTFDLSTLPTGFDVSKTSDWTNGTVDGNILTVEDTSKSITYKYDCGNGHSETFTLIPPIAETPAETTTTPAAPKTTTTTTTTTTPETITTVTTTPATTTNIESDSTTNTTTSTTYTPAATSTTAKPIPTPIETYGTCGAQGSNVTWTYDGNGTLTISGEGKMSNWYSNESPWFNKQEIETIIIEDGITNIGSFAFQYCHSLTSITIPESVTSIGYDAFNFCDSLASITIPESVTDISPGAFSGSKWFKTQQEKNLFVIVNGILIDGTACKGDVVIPDSVKTINEEAFERCYDLTEITIPESVTSIGKDAFNSCVSLNKITIKNPDCEIYDAAETICDGYYFSLFDYFTGKIYGYKNSTAQAYAEKYNIRFVAIDETPAETTTTATTTAPEITTTTTTTTAEEEITSVEINETNFPDYLLRYYITKYIDTDTDNILSAEEIADVTKLDISVGGIRELTGIHYFKNLEDLDCSGNKLTTIDISNFTALTRLDCGKNKLTSLDVSNNSALETLWCMANQLTSLDVSNNTALAYLSCRENQLTSLDLSNNTALTELYCYDNQLTSLDLSNNTALTELDCGKNQLTSLDVSNNTALTRLECYYNQLTSLDVSNNTALIRLVCYENQLTSIDVSHCSALTYLGCSNNQLTSLDVSNTKMQSTSAFQNEYEIALIGNTFDLSTLPAGFDVSKASNWTNATVEGNILTVEDITKEVTYKYDCGNRNSETFTLIPQIEETPAETTTTTAAPETTITTTATTTVTTTPATTTPEDDLPQTGFSKLYNCIPVSAGALVLLGMYAVKKSKKEDEEE